MDMVQKVKALWETVKESSLRVHFSYQDKTE
jgi:hypothetical protein